MERKSVAVILLLAMLLSVLPAEAAVTLKKNVSLSFTDTTANCSGTVMGSGSISATLELWQGSTKLISWPGNGSGYVQINESYTVVSGVTYTLKLNGTINGVAFTEASVTRTCP
ncbi:MAG: hypothetical protein J5496_04080 [Lachnospiraceae bacterium]|nr:hypothetical protein [Lachnospiraceae bacterium]